MNPRRVWRAARVVGAALALTVFCAVASADTLTLKDGRVFHGRYLGGTADTIEMEVNGQVQTFDLRDVQSLSREPAQPAAKPAPDSAPAAAPGQLPEAPAPQGNPPPAAAPSAALPAVVPPAPDTSGKVTLPVGTRILVRMIDSVDSEHNRVGDRFRASLESNLEQDGVLLARRGTEVYGDLALVQGAGRLAGHAELKLELTGMLIHNSLVPLITGNYDVAGKGRGGNTGKKVAGGAVLGALIGALAGGGKGAAIGAGVGAGAGATVNIITKGEKVRVPSETLLEFSLDAPLALAPEAPPAR